MEVEESAAVRNFYNNQMSPSEERHLSASFWELLGVGNNASEVGSNTFGVGKNILGVRNNYMASRKLNAPHCIRYMVLGGSRGPLIRYKVLRGFHRNYYMALASQIANMTVSEINFRLFQIERNMIEYLNIFFTY